MFGRDLYPYCIAADIHCEEIVFHCDDNLRLSLPRR